MKLFSETNIGSVRSSNQDTFRQSVLTEDCLWSLVCDGMGGVNGGNIASCVAADTIEAILAEEFSYGMEPDALRELSFRAISEANSAVFSRAVDEPELKGMGTTAVLALVSGGRLYLSHVGDSRAYLKRDGQISQLTTDHSFVQDLVDRGEITQAEARTHPRRNIITRSVGVHSIVENDYQELELRPGDIYLACSDGLSNYAEDATLYDILEKTEGPDAANALIQYALTSGGADNITVSLIYV